MWTAVDQIIFKVDIPALWSLPIKHKLYLDPRHFLFLEIDFDDAVTIYLKKERRLGRLIWIKSFIINFNRTLLYMTIVFVRKGCFSEEKIVLCIINCGCLQLENIGGKNPLFYKNFSTFYYRFSTSKKLKGKNFYNCLILNPLATGTISEVFRPVDPEIFIG